MSTINTLVAAAAGFILGGSLVVGLWAPPVWAMIIILIVALGMSLNQDINS